MQRGNIKLKQGELDEAQDDFYYVVNKVHFLNLA